MERNKSKRIKTEKKMIKEKVMWKVEVEIDKYGFHHFTPLLMNLTVVFYQKAQPRNRQTNEVQK